MAVEKQSYWALTDLLQYIIENIPKFCFNKKSKHNILKL